jgi:hypothetical protein
MFTVVIFAKNFGLLKNYSVKVCARQSQFMPKQEKSGFINFASQAFETVSGKIILIIKQTGPTN